jgi:hypothetical protein
MGWELAVVVASGLFAGAVRNALRTAVCETRMKVPRRPVRARRPGQAVCIRGGNFPPHCRRQAHSDSGFEQSELFRFCGFICLRPSQGPLKVPDFLTPLFSLIKGS